MDFQAPFTLVFLLITVLTSFAGFQNESLIGRTILWPARMQGPADYYRFITSGFIHQDTMHLLFNMFTFYFIGENVEVIFRALGMHLAYPLLYLGGIVFASLPSFLKNRNNPAYRSLGASGGVAAVLFASVYFAPWAQLLLYFIAVPSIVFAVLYLAYSVYMGRKGNDNINHDAHFWGAVFGFVFTLLVSPDHGRFFIEQILHPQF
ncbi:MAG: rhomboid family intramembrane serine protease [Sphingobacteriales bacterium]|nr:MAG: rhomboid family intramembrane serine protease [Sphingobacteriales bacterium]